MSAPDAKKRLAELQKSSPFAAQCLFVAASLPEATIPLQFIRLGAPALGPAVSEAFAGAPADEQLEEALRPLEDLSLWGRRVEQGQFRGWRVERAGREAVKSALDRAARRQWAERVVRAADLYFRETKFGWADRPDIALGCAELIDRWDIDSVEAGWPLLCAASALDFKGPKGVDAEPAAGAYLRQVLQIFEEHLGADHLDTAAARYQLGRHLRKVHKRPDRELSEAAVHILSALQVRLKALPVADPLLLDNLSTIAEIYLERGSVDDAQRMLMPVMSAVMRTREAGPRLKVRANHNMARLLHLKGEHREAADVAEYALKLSSRLKTEAGATPTEDDILNHGAAPDTHGLLYEINLALGLQDEAGRHLARSLARRLDEGLEPTAWAEWIASDPGREDGRQPPVGVRPGMYEEAIAILGEKFGGNNPAALPVCLKLAAFETARDGYQSAEPYFRRALRIAEQAEPRDGVRLAECLYLWGKCLCLDSRYVDAEVQLGEAVALLDAQAAAPESLLLRSLDVYAVALKKQGRADEADEAQARADTLAARNEGVERFKAGDVRRFQMEAAATEAVDTAATAGSVVVKVLRVAFGAVCLFILLRQC